MRSRNLGFALAGALALAFGPGQAGASPDRPDVAYGKKVSESDLELWDIDIHTPSGAGLPPGKGTVAEGQKVYEDRCIACHGEAAKGGDQYGAMVGGIGTMTKRPRKVTPGSMYPYAPILFDYIRRAMPMDHPQSMTADEIYAVSAYILNLNGLIGKDAVLDAKTMSTIKMPNKDAFIKDDRPDTKAERCMKDCKPIGTVADAEK